MSADAGAPAASDLPAVPGAAPSRRRARRRAEGGVSPVVRLFMRLQYHPARYFNRAMYLTGKWRIWDWVDEHVLLGGAPSRREIRRLRDLGVGGVINLCEEFRGYQKHLRAAGLTQLWLPTIDYYPPTLEHVLEGLRFIAACRRRGQRVYVHCKAGQGRSTTLVMCYLMAAYRLSPRAAYRRIAEIRPHITKRLYRRAVIGQVQRLLETGALRGAFAPGAVPTAAQG